MQGARRKNSSGDTRTPSKWLHHQSLVDKSPAFLIRVHLHLENQEMGQKPQDLTHEHAAPVRPKAIPAQEQAARDGGDSEKTPAFPGARSASRRGFRKLSLPPLLILWREAELTPLPGTPCFALRRAGALPVLESAVKHPHVRLVLRLLLQLPLPLLLLLLPRQVLCLRRKRRVRPLMVSADESARPGEQGVFCPVGLRA